MPARVSSLLHSSAAAVAGRLARSNPSQHYPSDFSLLHFPHQREVGTAVKALEAHPLVRRVTPQRKLTRALSLVAMADASSGGDAASAPPPCDGGGSGQSGCAQQASWETEGWRSRCVCVCVCVCVCRLKHVCLCSLSVGFHYMYICTSFSPFKKKFFWCPFSQAACF